MNFFKKIQYNSPVTLTFTFLSLLVLILGILTNQASTYLLFSVYKSPATDIFGYIRLFGHVLGHANFAHYFNNFLIILLVGPMLEEKYGSVNLLIMMVFTALITGIIHAVFSNTILLGASGIVFMMILLSSYANYQKDKIPFTLILVIIVFIGREVASGIFLSDNISRITHIIGGIIGAVFGYYVNNKWHHKPQNEI